MGSLDLASLRALKRRDTNSNIPSDTSHIFSVDVEEWFQVGAFENTIDRESWTSLESRVAFQTEKILTLLDTTNTKATFFCLGWVADACPALIKKIAASGHEIASHGVDHRRIYEFDDASFRDDIAASKKILEDVSGQAVIGYRAPSFSMTADKWHFFEIMEECGYQYSSSVFPAKTDHYGIPNAPRVPFHPNVGTDFIEVPMSISKLGPFLLPASGGGYFRLLPSFVANALMNRSVSQTKCGVVFYMHPWEMDPDQPYVREAPLKSRFRHYTGQRSLEGRLERLLTEKPFMRADAFLAENYDVQVRQ